jgi:hypothetical protein
VFLGSSRTPSFTRSSMSWTSSLQRTRAAWCHRWVSVCGGPVALLVVTGGVEEGRGSGRHPHHKEDPRGVVSQVGVLCICLATCGGGGGQRGLFGRG